MVLVKGGSYVGEKEYDSMIYGRRRTQSIHLPCDGPTSIFLCIA